jgi:hypothetical protein
MKTARSRALALSTALLPLIAPGVGAAEGAGGARYEIVFERGWTSETHPKDFPLLAHFSPVIGETHAAGQGLFPIGSNASAGLEKLCEEGKHQPLDGEIRSAIGGGSAGMLIETMEPIREEHGRAMASFEVDAKHPYVSIAAMIAPSPDWCAAALDVDLRDGAGWVKEKRVELYSYDVGTDAAESYRALDDDMQPRGAVQANPSPYFNQQGRRTPVGSVTFVRQ